MAPRPRSLVLATLAIAAIALVGCSKDDKSSSTTTTTSPDAAPTSVTTSPNADNPTGGDTKAFVDIMKCENTAGVGTSEGSIKNTGDTTASYDLEIQFLAEQTNVAITTASTRIASVAPGAESQWTVTAQGLDPSVNVECHTFKVTTASG